MNTDLAKVEANKVETTFNEIYGIADAFYKSGLFADVRSQAQAVVKIMAGRELGLGPFYSMSRINIIQGKIGLAAETLGLLLKRSGKYDYTVKEHDDSHCVIEFTQAGKPVYESAFSLDDAKRAGLIKQGSGWEKYPRAMLFSRALSQGARVVAPDAIGGAYTDEELQSIPKVEVEEVEQPKTERLTAKEQAEFAPAKPEPAKVASDLPTFTDGVDLFNYALGKKRMSLESIARATGTSNPKDIKDVEAAARALFG